VEINAAERQPVIAWKKDEVVSWLDEEGVVFPVRGEVSGLITLETAEDLPLAAPQTTDLENLTSGAAVPVTADSGQMKVHPELVQATKRLSEKLPAETRLVYSAENGLGWVDKEGWQVFIGTDLNNFEERYLMYQALTNHLKAQGLVPVLVSVEHLNAPFYRLEP
jgi:cell division protein FtsQ